MINNTPNPFEELMNSLHLTPKILSGTLPSPDPSTKSDENTQLSGEDAAIILEKIFEDSVHIIHPDSL